MLAALTLFGAMALAPLPNPAHRAAIEAWRAKRLASLTAEDGWLSVVGLWWLEPGDNSVGSAPGSAVRLPDGAPARVGAIALEGSRLKFRADRGGTVLVDGKPADKSVSLSSDAEGAPTLLSVSTLRFYVIKRGGRFAVRVTDAGSEARRDFRGLAYFAIDPAWRIEARFEPYAPPRSIPVPNVLGHVDQELSPGALVFEHAGNTYRLDPVLERGETDYFVIFGDRTNGVETYGAGRFLYVSPPVDGKTVLDFNKAYSPPCAFTDYATCPLPPAQNRLPFRVEAGEKMGSGL